MYQLEYEEPYEFDDNDSAGGNEICHSIRHVIIDANTDEEARAAANVFLEEGGLKFAGKMHKRNGLRLMWTEEREVMQFDDFSHADAALQQQL